MKQWKNLFEIYGAQGDEAEPSGSLVTGSMNGETSGSLDEQSATGAVAGYQSPNAFDYEEREMFQRRANIPSQEQSASLGTGYEPAGEIDPEHFADENEEDYDYEISSNDFNEVMFELTKRLWNHDMTTTLLEDVRWAYNYERSRLQKPNWKAKCDLIYNLTENDVRFYTKKRIAESTAAPGTQTKLRESAPPGWERVVLALKRHPEITNPLALAWAMRDKGFKPREIEEAINRWLARFKNGLREVASVSHFERMGNEFTQEETVAHNLLRFAADNNIAGIGAFPQSPDETPGDIGKATMIDFDFPLTDGGKVVCYVVTEGQRFDYHVFKADDGSRLEHLGSEANLDWDALLAKVRETFNAVMELKADEDGEEIAERKHGTSMPSKAVFPKSPKAALNEWAARNRRIIAWKK